MIVMPKVASRLERAKTALLEELRQEVSDPRVLEAVAQVPRERFLPPDIQPFAYENRPLPIGYGQTISQPLIVALMTEALELKGDEKVLEIGTGSGYQAALLAKLAREVISVERIQPLAHQAARVVAELGLTNLRIYVAGQELGWPQEAPYDAIIVTAGAPDVPQQLLDQLAMGGRLVIPVGNRDVQELLRLTRIPDGLITERLGPCRFVPLIGPGAWPSGVPY
jgi:protein-L-isoaspartate(D-aspartate) O-methyltransferase